MCLKDGDRHLVYPKIARHSDLALHPLTDITTLVDVLALSNKNNQCKVVQVLARLEQWQIKVAYIKSLQDEEERVSEIEEQSLLKTEPDKVRLAPALSELLAIGKQSTSFLASIPRDTLASTEFEQYKKPLDYARQITALQDAEVTKAVGRWHSALEVVCNALSNKFPDRWRARAIDEHDEDFVKNKVLQQSLISSMGTDYLSATQWVACFKKNFQSMVDAFEEQHKGEFTKFEAILGDSCDLSATTLAYNVMLHQFPKKSQSDRRQALKDLKKKFRTKIGKGYDMPQALSDRMLQHVNMK